MHNLVSVIVPCYNQAQYLDECLNSVLSQTYPNWECIIVNDGSPDNTEEVAHLWCNKDNRFMYLKKENGGLSSARNAGLKVANGEYIQFLDADDFLHREKFSLQIELLEGSLKYDIAICDYYPSDEYDLKIRYSKGRYLTPFPDTDDFLKHLILDWQDKFSVPCHCFIFRASLFHKYSVTFDESLPNHEDWDCWMQIFSISQKVVFHKEVLAIYRIREVSMCTDTTKMKVGFLMALRKQEKLFSNKLGYQKLILNRIDKVQFGRYFKNILDRKIFLAKKKYGRKLNGYLKYLS